MSVARADAAGRTRAGGGTGPKGGTDVVYGLVLTLFAVAILVTAPGVLSHAERAGFSPALVQNAWRAAAVGVIGSLVLAVPVLTVGLWSAPLRALGFGLHPGGGFTVPSVVQGGVAMLAIAGAVQLWRYGGPVCSDYRRALHVQLGRLESCSPVLEEDESGHPRLVIVEDSAPRLVLLPSHPPRVEVTTRALDLLRPEELNAVLTHMSGHLRRSDAAWLVLADTLAEAFGHVPFFVRWADRSAALAEKAADADVRGGIPRKNLRRAIVKLAGPGQVSGPFCPCFAWPQQRQQDLDTAAGGALAHAGGSSTVMAVAGLRVLSVTALVVPTLVVVAPYLISGA